MCECKVKQSFDFDLSSYLDTQYHGVPYVVSQELILQDVVKKNNTLFFGIFKGIQSMETTDGTINGAINGTVYDTDTGCYPFSTEVPILAYQWSGIGGKPFFQGVRITFSHDVIS